MNLKINQFYRELTKLTALCKVWIHHNYTSWTAEGKIFRINKKHIGEEIIIWSFRLICYIPLYCSDICLKISSGKGIKRIVSNKICTFKNERIHGLKKLTFSLVSFPAFRIQLPWVSNWLFLSWSTHKFFGGCTPLYTDLPASGCSSYSNR